MSTRVTSAIASRKARENLARLLFPSADGLAASSSFGASSSASPLPDDTTGMKFSDRHSHSYRRRHRPRPGDAGDGGFKGQREKRHSYVQLRAAYLQRVHDMHPDKVMHRNQQQSSSEDGFAEHNNNLAKDAHLQFIELKNAWEEYHASVRLVRDAGSTNTTNTNAHHSGQDDEFWEEDEESFTLFGVGCSFADNPEERALRDEIMDQACKGWFSSGSLSHEEGAGESIQQLRKAEDTPKTKLSDDDMFVRDDPIAAKYPRERKCLVPNMNRPRRKR